MPPKHLTDILIRQLNLSLEFLRDRAKNINLVVISTQIIQRIRLNITWNMAVARNEIPGLKFQEF